MDTKKTPAAGKGRPKGTAERLREALEPLDNDQMADLSERSGVPFHTIRKIRTGETDNPKCHTVDRLFHALAGRDQSAA